MKFGYFAPMLALAAAGCMAKAETVPEDPKIWGRVDCQRIEGNPAVQQDAEQTKSVCLGRGEAAAIAGTAAMPVGRGLGGAIVSGVDRSITQNQIGNATIMSCMAERGWLLRTGSEHAAACESLHEQKMKTAVPADQPKKRSAKQPPDKSAPESTASPPKSS